MAIIYLEGTDKQAYRVDTEKQTVEPWAQFSDEEWLRSSLRNWNNKPFRLEVRREV